jgi:hypothetical protein
MKPNRKLKTLVAKLAEVCWDGDTLDGSELQDLLVEAGVLTETIADEPCGPNCRCRACDAGWPAICYRLSGAYK